MKSVLESPNPHRMWSLASKINNRKGAMTADELAELLGVSRLTVLRPVPSAARSLLLFESAVVRFDPANIAQWLVQMGVKRMSQKQSR